MLSAPELEPRPSKWQCEIKNKNFKLKHNKHIYKINYNILKELN